jgi:ribonucleoside-diphosphate reductase alpha chain
MKDEQAFEWLQQNDLSYKIWENKYRHNNESFNEWLTRVSGKDEELKQLIKEKKFLFGGRILANRGLTDAKLTLSNCYVITPPEDNLESIFECASKLARTFSYGGGCGIDLSKLRPNGAKTHNASKTSTGPISFMDIFSQVTGTISQQGRRKMLIFY